MTLSFTLLGHVSLANDGGTLNRFRSRKEAALLIYLAQTGQTHRRDHVAELLWSARTTQRARGNLRTALTRLRKQVGDALHVTHEALALAPEIQQHVDSVRLLHALRGSRPIGSAMEAAALQKALDSYRGDFPADFHLRDASRFNEWIQVTREYIRREVIAGYERLAQYAISTGDTDYGIAVSDKWLEVDALDEAAHTLLIQLLLERGQVSAALTHYDYCVDLLRSELGIGPPAQIGALIQDAREKHTGGQFPASAKVHNLPPSYNRFFGRKLVQEEIHARLDEPSCRLLTITGQGGVGKTRLATRIARGRLSLYADGVWMVDLADLEPDDDDVAEAIAAEIATTLDLRLTGPVKPVEQLIDHLRHKRILLILDNFDHLHSGIKTVLDILQSCEEVQLLVTSREALRILAEWRITLLPLSFPAGDRDESPSDAVDLFLARRSQHQWKVLSPDETAAVRTICRLVGGLPLAVELAAALTRHKTARAVADALRKDFDVLTTPLRDVPKRHRGLSVVFQMSWQTLTPALQRRLARLSVFRHGFTAAAASEIAGAGADHLAALCEKSLLTHDAESDRYALHPVIRAYAAQKRPAKDRTPEKHTRYYLAMLARHSDSPPEAIRALEPEMENIRQAWQRGLAERNADWLCSALEALAAYYRTCGLYGEGEAILQTTASAAMTWGARGIVLAARARGAQARFREMLGSK